MDSKDVELVKRIVRDEVGAAINVEGKRIEADVIAAMTAFHEGVERRVQHDHAENRTRLQQNLRETTKAVAQNEFIIKSVEEGKTETRELREQVSQLLSEVKTWAGRRAGEAASDEKFEKKKTSFYAAMRWVGGLLATAGVWKWVASYFHWSKK